MLVVAAPGAAGVLDAARSRRSGPSIAFVCFCLAASSTYFLNDALDVEADRHHPTQALPPGRGRRGEPCAPRSVGGIVLAVAAIALSFAARWQLALVIGGYFVLDDRLQRRG